MASFADILKSIGANAAKTANIGKAGSGLYDKLVKNNAKNDKGPAAATANPEYKRNAPSSSYLPPLPYIAQNGNNGNEDIEQGEQQSKFGGVANEIAGSISKNSKPKKENNVDPLSLLLGGLSGGSGVLLRPEPAHAEEIGNVGDEMQEGASSKPAEKEEGESKSRGIIYPESSPVGKRLADRQENPAQTQPKLDFSSNYDMMWKEIWPLLQYDIAYNRQDPFNETPWINDGMENVEDIFALSDIPQGFSDEELAAMEPADFETGVYDPELEKLMDQAGIKADRRRELPEWNPLTSLGSQEDEFEWWKTHDPNGIAFAANHPDYDFMSFRLETDPNILNQILGFGDYADMGIPGWSGKWGRYQFEDPEEFYKWWIGSGYDYNDIFENTNEYDLGAFGGYDGMYSMYNWFANNGYFNDLMESTGLTPQQLAVAFVAGQMGERGNLTESDWADLTKMFSDIGLDINAGYSDVMPNGRKSPYVSWEDYAKLNPSIAKEAEKVGLNEKIPELLELYNSNESNRKIGLR